MIVKFDNAENQSINLASQLKVRLSLHFTEMRSFYKFHVDIIVKRVKYLDHPIIRIFLFGLLNYKNFNWVTQL